LIRPAGHFGVRQEHLLFPMAGFRTRFPSVTPVGTVLLPVRTMISAMFRAVLNPPAAMGESAPWSGFGPDMGVNVTFM
jgi:hypothetical protein